MFSVSPWHGRADKSAADAPAPESTEAMHAVVVEELIPARTGQLADGDAAPDHDPRSVPATAASPTPPAATGGWRTKKLATSDTITPMDYLEAHLPEAPPAAAPAAAPAAPEMLRLEGSACLALLPDASVVGKSSASMTLPPLS